MQAEIIGLVRVRLWQAALGVREIDIFPDLVHADALVEHIAYHQGFTQLVVAEAAACAFHSLFSCPIPINNTLNSFSSN